MQVHTMSHRAHRRLIVSSAVIAIITFVMVWATYGPHAPLRIPVSMNASSLEIMVGGMLPQMAFFVVLAAAGYLLLGRKIAIVSAVSTAILGGSLYGGTYLVGSGAAKLGVMLAVTVMVGGLFYVLHTFMNRTARPKVASALLLGGSLLVSMVVSIAIHYFVRLSFPL